MKVTYKISRTKAGILGGTAFSVHVHVTLSSDEKAIRDEFGSLTSFEIGDERFKDVKGVNSGYMRLDSFTSGAEFKLPNIQQAGDFLDEVLGGLQQVQNQIDVTKAYADKLDQEFTKDL